MQIHISNLGDKNRCAHSWVWLRKNAPDDVLRHLKRFIRRHGYVFSSGKQRYRNLFTRTTFVLPDDSELFSRVHKKRHAKQAVALLVKGESIRMAAQRTGLAKQTVNKLRMRLIKIGIPLVCGCGQDSAHRGWCNWRYKRSKRRQSVFPNCVHKEMKAK